MVKLHYNKIRCAALIMLIIPAYIFLISWVKPLIGLPCAFLISVALVHASNVEDRVINVRLSTLITISVLILLWAFLSGQGGFFTQKSDYEYRNVIFRDLLNYKWPVVYGGENDESLVYYIGYWLLPALIGKVAISLGNFATGWLVARIAILLWTVVLVYTAFLLVLFRIGKGRRKAVYIAFAVFVLFSGMDALCSLAHPEDFSSHLEWWAGYFQYSSMSTQLCWVFNQAVPTWLACAIAFNEKDEKSFAFIGLALLPTSPLPLVGLAAYMLAFAVKDFVVSVKQKQVKQFFGRVFTVQNIIAVVTLLPVFGLYYLNNVYSTAAQNSVPAGSDATEVSAVSYIVMYIMFVLFEFGFLLMFVKNKKRRFDSLVILVTLLIIPFIKVGTSIDFCMRASIPSLFLLMILLIEYLVPELTRKKPVNEDKNSKEYLKRAKRLLTVMLIFIIGCGTPFVEYLSSTIKYINTGGECVTQFDYMDTLATVPLRSKKNFVGTQSHDSAFYKYLANDK